MQARGALMIEYRLSERMLAVIRCALVQVDQTQRIDSYLLSNQSNGTIQLTLKNISGFYEYLDSGQWEEDFGYSTLMVRQRCLT